MKHCRSIRGGGTCVIVVELLYIFLILSIKRAEVVDSYVTLGSPRGLHPHGRCFHLSFRSRRVRHVLENSVDDGVVGVDTSIKTAATEVVNTMLVESVDHSVLVGPTTTNVQKYSGGSNNHINGQTASTPISTTLSHEHLGVVASQNNFQCNGSDLSMSVPGKEGVPHNSHISSFMNEVNGVSVVNGVKTTILNATRTGQGDINSIGASIHFNATAPATSEYLFSSEAFPDVPVPTVNGGYSHTAVSRAKISAANKGRVPWNKGVKCSDERKAKISAGVRERNRANLLAKLAAQGLTEEEYLQQKEEEKKVLQKEKNSRRTSRGGYVPSPETRAKISQILKEKYRNGEMPKRNRTKTISRHNTTASLSNSTSVSSSKDPQKRYKKPRVHSAETREKIRQSMLQRWHNDTKYRERMLTINRERCRADNITNGSNSMEVRQKISATLKARWEDPDFREYMTQRMAERKHSPRGISHREKISEAMKRKWAEDAEYRAKAVKGMARAAASRPRSITSPPKPRKRPPGRTSRPKKSQIIQTTMIPAKPIASSSGTVVRAKPRPKPVVLEALKPKRRIPSASSSSKNLKPAVVTPEKRPIRIEHIERPEETALLQNGQEHHDDDDYDDGDDVVAKTNGKTSLSDASSSQSVTEMIRRANDEFSALFGLHNDDIGGDFDGSEDDDDFDLEDYDPYGLDELERERRIS